MIAGYSVTPKHDVLYCDSLRERAKLPVELRAPLEESGLARSFVSGEGKIQFDGEISEEK